MHPNPAEAIRAARAATRAAITSRYPGLVQIEGDTYEAAVTYGEFEEQLRDGGIAMIRGCSILIARTALASRPAGGTAVTVQGEYGGTFYVRSVLGDLASDSWLLRCSANRA